VSNAVRTDIVVIGAGVGGYSAAFRASDLGKHVVLIDSRDLLGGVCLQEGCIPSKALLHAAQVIEQTKEMSQYGLEYELSDINFEKLLAWKNNIVHRLTGGLRFLADKRKVTLLPGRAAFVNEHEIIVDTQEGVRQVVFSHAIIATGSTSRRLNFLPKDPMHVIDSAAALNITSIPKRLLILGGGVIGLEMATIYAAMGSVVTVVEQANQLMPMADPDLVSPLFKRLVKRMKIYLNTKLTNVVSKADGLWVLLEGAGLSKDPIFFDKMLYAIGRTPNTAGLHLEQVSITPNTCGFIKVNHSFQTHHPHIYAVGDVIGQPMLAHKSAAQGRLVAELIVSAKKRRHEALFIPSVAYTNPEVAWVGLTEHHAKKENIHYKKAILPWVALGKAHALNRTEGLTKLLFHPHTHQLLGAGIVGMQAGDLIAELSLAIQLKATAEQIAHTIHPHPTLSEGIMIASEIFEGTATDVWMPKKEDHS
jgi:dihydrolipoamide dehydrogenase